MSCDRDESSTLTRSRIERQGPVPDETNRSHSVYGLGHFLSPGSRTSVEVHHFPKGFSFSVVPTVCFPQGSRVPEVLRRQGKKTSCPWVDLHLYEETGGGGLPRSMDGRSGRGVRGRSESDPTGRTHVSPPPCLFSCVWPVCKCA